MQGTILVATAGQGILRSCDDGRHWHRLGLKEAIEFDGTVRALAVDPRDPARVWAGADCGLCISHDGGAHFARVDAPMNGQTVWSLCIDPGDSRVVYAGTGAPSRCQLYRSLDGGASWRAISHQFPEFCAGVNRPRLLTIAVDPHDGNDLWFGVEEGGAWRSRDGGAHWERIDGRDQAIRISDIHAIAITRAPDGAKTILLLTVNAVYRSSDDGASWTARVSRECFDGQYYTRTVQALADGSAERLLAVGDGTPGTRSSLYRSGDDGQSWNACALDQPPNSTFWCFGCHAADPALLFAGTKYGHLYRSTDRGRSWRREWREFSEITAIAWTPHVAPLVAHAQSTTIPAATELPVGHGSAPNANPAARSAQGTAAIRPRIRRTHIALFVQNPFASAPWYQDVLGMQETARGAQWVFLSFGRKHHDIALIQAPQPFERGSINLQHYGLEIDGDVDELRRLYAMLLDKQVPVVKTSDHKVGLGVYFTDPDGHRFEFFCETIHDDALGRQVLHDHGAPSIPITLEPLHD